MSSPVRDRTRPRRPFAYPARPVIRGGSGLGDSLYLQAVCRHMIAKGIKLKVCSNYPEIFAPLGDAAHVQEFKRIGVNYLAHYSQRRHVKETTQFQDCCIQARINSPVELKLDWVVSPAATWWSLKDHGKPISIVGLPRAPMGRADGLGAELLPSMGFYQKIIDYMRESGFLIVQVGSGHPLHQLRGIDVDLANQTTITDLIDIVALADAVICYPSFLIPLAESLDKRFLTLFSSRGLECHHNFLRFITPQKVIHRKDLGSFVIDTQPEALHDATAHFFRP